MSSAEHAKIQLQMAVEGEARSEYADAPSFAKDLVASRKGLEAWMLEFRKIVDKGLPFLTKQNPSLETMGGFFMTFRAMADMLKEARVLVDTGQRPLSIRSVCEMRMAARMMFQQAKTGEPFPVYAHGKQFVATGKCVPTMPDPKKNAADHQKLLDLLQQTGKGSIIKPGQDLSYDEVSDALASMMKESKEAGNPWGEILKVVIAPSIRMSEDKRKEKQT